MTVERRALAASVVFAGPWSGLLAMLTTMLHPMLAAMDGRDFRNFRGAFLRFAPEATPMDWEAGRRRYFTINWINAISTWVAFVLFLAALLSL